jgi:hypothetical protein
MSREDYAKIVLPTNACCGMLALWTPNEAGHSVRRIRVQAKKGIVSLSALILPAEKVVPKHILPTLPATHFEIVTKPTPGRRSHRGGVKANGGHMNTLVANQYGRVEGKLVGCGLPLAVVADTPRRESFHHSDGATETYQVSTPISRLVPKVPN